MPPKLASTTSPRRRPVRFTAQKSILYSTTSIPFYLPPSTAVSTSSELSEETKHQYTGNTTSTLQFPAHATTPASQAQSQSSQETLACKSGFVYSDIGIDGNNCKESGQSLDLENSGVGYYGPEKIINVEAATVVGSGEGSKNGANSYSLPVERQHVQSGSSVEPVIRIDSAAVGVAGSGIRKTKIVKKTVRVLKKVIKRVPKRVIKNGLQSQGLVVKAEDGVNLSEVREKLNIAKDVIENSDDVVEKTSVVNEANDIVSTGNGLTENSNIVNEVHDHVDRVTEKTSVIDEVLKKENITDKVTQQLELVNFPNVSEPVIGEKDNDLSGIAYVESEGPKLNSSASFLEKQVPAIYSSGINSGDAENVRSTDGVSEVDRNNLIICAPGLVDVEKVNNDTGTIMETIEIASTMTENQSESFVVENDKIDTVDKDGVELHARPNVCLVAEKIVVLDEGENGRMIRKIESGSEVDSDHNRLTEGLILSEEMEALERKKRRKTEIFLGGLDRNTKEEDIRKVFGEAGMIVEVRLVMSRPGKNRGFAFVRFATATDAKNAVAKYSKVEICGRQCNVAPVEGNDTIFLGNIDRNWKSKDVVALLEKAGIEKLDRVTLKTDPNGIEKNRGFAFVEFQTSKDAQTAFSKLQKKNVFGKRQMVKVAWAQPLAEPSDEEILQVKSVYAEYLPSSWDEEKVKDYFRRFGEIESVVLAKDLPSSRRNDFAFINYTARDAALTCIETVNRERLQDNCSKVKIAVSIAKPVPKGKQLKPTSDLTSKKLFESKEKAFQTFKKLHEPRNKEKAASSSFGHAKVGNGPSTTDELVQILRQQASNKNMVLHPRTGTDIPDHHFSLPGSKRPFSLVGPDPLYVEHVGFTRPRVESSYPRPGPSSSSHGAGLPSFPYRHRQGPGLVYEPVNEKRIYPGHFQYILSSAMIN